VKGSSAINMIRILTKSWLLDRPCISIIFIYYPLDQILCESGLLKRLPHSLCPRSSFLNLFYLFNYIRVLFNIIFLIKLYFEYKTKFFSDRTLNKVIYIWIKLIYPWKLYFYYVPLLWFKFERKVQVIK
jgi:hypothetical protein